MATPPDNTAVFTMDTPALPMNYPGFVFRTLCEDGYDGDALLEGTNLEPEVFADPYFRTDFLTLRRFILNAEEQTGDPHLGARLALRFDVTYIGFPAYAAMNAPRLVDGLKVLSRFVHLTFPAIELSFPDPGSGHTTDETEVCLTPKLPLEEIAYFVNASALIVLNRLMLDMLRVPLVATRAETTISEPEGWAEIAEEVSRVPIRFDAPENRIIFPAELLDHALPCSDPINHAKLVALCEKFAADAGHNATPVSQVLAFLEKGNNVGVPLSEAATGLGYSERGLRRQLERAGTTYRTLVDQVRERRAREMLSSSTQTIQSIAHELGYDAPSNFARSFKRWTGQTPKAFREALQKREGNGQN
ncbi:helix-turn-helix domain-containing protein [candidate division GN15 bacterium]|nr:helix-turn-helix domain-containing protein [candidate division GN15 bacterium]